MLNKYQPLCSSRPPRPLFFSLLKLLQPSLSLEPELSPQTLPYLSLLRSLIPLLATAMSTPAFKFFPKTQSEFKPPLIANENAFLGDVFTTDDSEKPMSAGIYRLEKGTPLVYTYTYHETKIILEGEFDITDETGQTVHVSPKGCPKATCDTDMLCHIHGNTCPFH